MKLKNVVNRILLPLRKGYYLSRYSGSSPASVAWLIGTEYKYGGIVTSVPRNKVSPQDPRTKQKISQGGMTGGDRMLHHRYARNYSEYLLPFVEKGKAVTLAEFGILKGTGLAMWCDLFDSSRIMGFDIDLGHTEENMNNLKDLGAFKKCQPELYEFDQFLDNTKYLGEVLNGGKIDICIDDGYHSIESIMKTMKSVIPYLADEFVYIIEDNDRVHNEIRAKYPDYKVDNIGELTIVSQIN